MILENMAVTGFRGISQLSLPLEGTNVLIGENAWGKSSLLDALTLLLAPQPDLYAFRPHDFHFAQGDAARRERDLQVVFTFCEREAGEADALHYQVFAPLWWCGEDGLRRLTLKMTGHQPDTGEVITHRQFVDACSQPLLTDERALAAIKTLIRLHPVLRLRDARFSRRQPHDAAATLPAAPFAELTSIMEDLLREGGAGPQNLSDSALREGVNTLRQLVEHYFSVQSPQASLPGNRVSHLQRESGSGWRHLGEMNHLIAGGDRSRRLILLRLFALLVQARDARELDAQARPLLVLEDPETRLHPIMLSVAWELLSLLPLQKMVTTNSGELLSQVPVEQVCRLVREPGRVAAWRIGPSGMSAEDSRRIAFHIRFNRPSSLFARCWLLVEGETEVWVMNELARQCGYHFAAEGIKVIEFAQSGLRPLLKFARRMGIAWHVLTDGDDAGRKYAATARGMLQQGDRHEDHYLTQLPALDMEHFLYKQGFAAVYHRMSGLPAGTPLNLRRIIAKAIQHASKPELAIAVAAEAASRGTDSVPELLRSMFSRVQRLARGNAD
ncbi:ATP-dependent endonuclease [Erwinia persicina]|uniref:ATP-dependent nuclease n=1 Tax=Erwinia persicina TaxID=55211 RepID=UPI00210409C5|nr:ATP-dependent endonuclease [Erwinia persicina]MCQ4106735.1 ATP-dependent endonuclease [Erwinia persicina]UTX11641.1 ATP-dependent endonuclease [Erwinia persicina]